MASPMTVLCWHDDQVYVRCADGALQLLEFELGADITSAAAFHQRFGTRALLLKPVME